MDGAMTGADAGRRPQAPPAVSRGISGPGLGTRKVLRRSGAASGLAMALAGMDAVAAVIVSRALGPGDRGVFVLAATIAGFAALFSQAGISTAGRLALVRRSDPIPLPFYLGSCLVHTMAAGGIGSLAAAGSFFLLFDRPSWFLVSATALLTMAMTAFYLLADALNAYGRTPAAMLTSAAGSGVFVAVSLLGTHLGWVPATFLLANAGTITLQALLALALLRRPGPLAVKLSWNRHREFVRVGIAAVPYVLGTALVFRLDRYIIGLLSNEGHVGVYSIAASLSEVGRFLPNAVGQLLFFGAASGAVAETVRNRTRMISLVVTMPVLLVVAFMAEPVVDFTLGDEFAAAVAPLRILLLGELFAASMLIDVRILAGSGRLWAASGVTMAALAVTITLDVVLVPTHGISGAAIATALSYLVGAAVARRFVSLSIRATVAPA